MDHQSNPTPARANADSGPFWLRPLRFLGTRLPFGRYRLIHATRNFQSEPFTARGPLPPLDFLFQCHMGDAIAREVALTGLYEPQETAIIKRFLRPGACFVDVGANWGYFTLLGSSVVGGGGTVFSLEPDPRNFERLSTNLTLNGLENVRAFQIAASNEMGELELYGYDESTGNFGTSSLTKIDNPGAVFSVPTQPLDLLLEGVEHIDFMKMDIEGGEALAIEGAKTLLKDRKVGHLLLELHPDQLKLAGSSAEKLIDTITGAGYSGWLVDHSREVSREVAYGPGTALGRYLQPLGEGVKPGNWPHILWESPDIPQSRSVRANLDN